MERKNDKGKANTAFIGEENKAGNCDVEIQIDEIEIKSDPEISTTNSVTFGSISSAENGEKDLSEYITFTAKKTPYTCTQRNEDSEEVNNATAALTVTSSNFKRWFVLLAGCFNHIVSVGFPFSMSVLYAEWLNEFGKSNSETSLIQSTCTGTFFIGGFLSGILISKYGSHKCGLLGGILATVGMASSYFATGILYLVLLLGVMCGFGLSLCYIGASTMVGMYFHGRSKMMALAFVAFCSGAGPVVFPILLEMLITIYGWRGTLLIIAGIMFNLVVSASMFTVSQGNSNINEGKEEIKEINPEENSTFDEDNNSTNATKAFQPISTIGDKAGRLSNVVVQDKPRRISFNTSKIRRLGDSVTTRNEGSLAIFKAVMLNRIFLLFAFSCALSISTFASMFIFLIDYFQSKGFSRTDAVMIYLYMNITNMAARLLFGVFKQLPHVSSLSIPVIGTSVGLVSAAAFPLVGSSYYLNLIAACGIGIINASMISSLTVCMVKIIGQDQYPAGLGIAMTSVGLFQSIAGPVSGYIRDATGNYDASFFSASAAFFIAFICFMITMVYRHNTNRNKHSQFDFELIIRRKPRRRSSIIPWKRKSVDLSLPA